MISRASHGRYRRKSTVNDYARNKKLPRNIRASLPLDAYEDIILLKRNIAGTRQELHGG